MPPPAWYAYSPSRATAVRIAIAESKSRAPRKRNSAPV